MDEADTAQAAEPMTDDAAATRPSDDDDEAPDYATEFMQNGGPHIVVKGNGPC